MAKRKIIWSHRAKIKLYSILEFYSKRNKSNTYSISLYKNFDKEVKKLTDYPELGIKTEMRSIRGLIIKNYVFYYEVNQNSIIIHTIWDSRQNPEDLEIK